MKISPSPNNCLLFLKIVIKLLMYVVRWKICVIIYYMLQSKDSIEGCYFEYARNLMLVALAVFLQRVSSFYLGNYAHK